MFDPAKRREARIQPEIISTEVLQESYKLNLEQARALSDMLRIRPVGLLQGPPGTGKTVFIAALAHFALTHGLAQNALLASQSHEAVNHAAEAVLRLFDSDKKQPSMLRVGMEGSVSDRLLPYHAAYVEQLYKDRFRASLRERLVIGGRSLGIPIALIDDLISIEMGIRPLVEKIAELEREKLGDVQRLEGLRTTLRHQLVTRGIDIELDFQRSTQDLIEDIVDGALSRDADLHVSLDQVAQLRALAQLARDFIGSVSTRTRSFEPFLAGTRQIVAGTCVGLGRSSLELTTTPFDLVIVDEAARCTASEMSVPIQAGRWVVLVGDHAQLEPQYKAEVVERVAAQLRTTRREVVRSDFERVFQTSYGKAAGRRLIKQYRMLPPIGRVVSTAFYEGLLEHGRTEMEIDATALPSDLDLPIVWIATESLGEQSFEKQPVGGKSYFNSAEADLIISTLRGWDACERFRHWLGTQSKYAHPIGIICTYAEQRDLIRRRLQTANLSDAFKKAIKIDTVDSYQGKENPIVLLSLVRHNTDGHRERGIATVKDGFLSRPNRINVAVSRAMDRLVIIGAHHRWASGSPMARLVAAVDEEVRRGEARIELPSSRQQRNSSDRANDRRSRS